LKPENIIVNNENSCKISNASLTQAILTFPLSLQTERINSQKQKELSTFMHLNVVKVFFLFYLGKSEAFAAKPVDIWALAVSLFIMTFRALPFVSKDNNMYEIINMIAAGE
jgi:hypothetical protein